MKRRFGVKVLAVLLTVMMLSALMPITALAESATTCIGITSDVHGSYTNISTWFSNNGDSLKYMVFGGDMGSMYWKTSTSTGELGTISTNASYSSDGDQTVGKINDLINPESSDTTPIYTMGNHDWYIGYSAYPDADTLSFEPITGCSRTGIQNDPDDDGFTIYTLGAASGSSGDGSAYTFLESDIADLEAELEDADPGEPFFIISHFPLHYGSSRAGQNTGELIDLLNGYPNVFFFWGHNHHSVESLMNTIKVAGETITPSDATSTTKTLNFTYANSSHMGSGDSVNGTGVYIEITDNDDSSSVTLTYKNMSGGTVGSPKTVNLGAASNEIAAVAVTGITSPAVGAAPDTDAAVSTSGVTASSVSWFTDGTPFTGTVFTAGEEYTALVTLTATGGKVFTASTAVTVNGKAATSVTLNTDGTLDVTYDFTQAAEPSLTYTKVSSASSGHQYAIVMSGVAMNTTPQTGSTSYYSYTGLGYTAPTISSDGNTLTFASVEDAEAATWTFEASGDADDWVISNEGSYLYSLESRSLTLNATNGSLWTFGTLEGKSQLYFTFYDDSAKENATGKLFYGGTTTVDFFYPTVNNNGDLTLYEKSSSEPTRVLDHIAITNPPAKTAYTAGETFSAAGMQVTAYYSDSSSAAVTGYSVSPSGALSVSDTEITITYQGKTASQAITVSPAVFFVYKKTTTITNGHEYAVVLDDVAMGSTAATGTANNNTYTGLSFVTPTISGDYLIFSSAADASSATWTFSADGSGWDIQNGTQYVNATAARTMSLGAAQAWTYGTLSGKGTQLSVPLGSSTYNLFYGGTTTVDFIYPSTNNNNTLTLYEKQPAALTGIEITTPPTKTAYSTGESFDAADMVVTARFSDDTTQNITGYTVLPSGALAVTDSFITVSFLGKTAAQPIDVFPAGSTTYTLASTIEAGGKYIIVSNKSGTTKALQNAVASTNYLANPAVTVSGDAVTSSVSADMIWTAEAGSTGMLFQNGGKYLARGSSVSGGYGLVVGSKPSTTLGDWLYSTDHHFYVTSSSSGNSYYLYTSSQGYFRMNATAQTDEFIYLYKQNTASVTLENITAAGAQTSYTEGQTFDPTGMVVTAHFSDGSSNTITNYIYTPSGVLSTENTRVTIVYYGKTAVIDITVAAVPVNYTVTWMNGTTRLDQDTDVPAGTAPSYDGSEPIKSATAQYTYAFAGWSTDPNAVTGTLEANLPDVSGTVIYYAVFTETPNQYTVTYAPGTQGTFTAQVTNNLIYGDTTPAAPTVTGQPGWTFAGWDSAPTATVTKTVTYTATWTQDKYTVTYAPGAYGVFMPQVTDNLVYGDATPTAPIVTSPSGWTFAGWDSTPTATVTKTVTYTATWTQDKYTVTYAPGTYGTFTTQVTGNLVYGDSTPDAPIVTGQLGWFFAGWDSTPTATVTKTVTYTATWTQDQYTVTYAPGAYGTFTTQVTGNLIYGDSTPDAPIVTGQSGWSFAGWDSTPAATVTKTVTYTATWTQDQYTVTYAPGAYGTFTTQATGNLIYGDSTPDAPIVTGQSGWSFAGWDSTPAATVTRTVTYTATWTQDSVLAVYADYSGAASVEGAENGKKIRITLTNGEFPSSISASQFTLTGLPAGVRKGTVTRVSGSVVTIVLLGNSNVDYDEDITVQIGIGKSQIQPTPDNNITASVTLAATVEPSPAAPTSASFSYSGSYANKLRGVTTAMEYSLDGGVSYTACKSTAVTLKAAQLGSLDAGKDILVRYEATPRVPAGIPQVIDLQRGADIPGSVVSSDEGNTLTGMSTAMEFSVNGGTAWTKYTGSNLPSLIGDVTIMVRYAAFDTTAAGAPAAFEFTSTNPLLSITAVNNGIIEGAESGKTITVTLTNGTFASSLSTRKITLNGLPAGVRLVNIKRTSATVATLTLSGNSTVDYDSDLTVTVSFDKSLFVPAQQVNLSDTFTITAAVENPPAAPTTATFTFSGTYANKLRGVTTAMEYSLDGGVSYTACKSTAVTLSTAQLSSLDAGKDILVRYKATLRADASDDQRIDLLEGDELPNTVEGNDATNQMSGIVKSTMEYSTNGKTWVKYSGRLPSLAGNITLYVRMCAHDNDLPGEAKSFVFTRKPFTIFWPWNE